MMRKFLLLGLSVLCLTLVSKSVADENEDAGDDMCEKCMLIGAGESDFCDKHEKGSAFGVEMKSKKLFDVLASERLNREEVMKCPGCKAASEGGGHCEKCNIYIVVPRGYKSVVAYRLAKGKPVQSEMAFRCDGCKKAWKENGACETCSLHFAAKRMYKDADAQKEGQAAHETLTSAAAAKCEACAVAMVTDGTCDHCKVSFKDGTKTAA